RVGVTEPVIFQNFGTKAALFTAVLERAAAQVRTSLDDMATDFGSVGALLEHVLAPEAHSHACPANVEPGRRHGGRDHARTAYGVLFADAATMASEPELTDTARDALQRVAGHLADLIQRAQADGGVRRDLDSQAAAWLLLSVISARRLRTAAMPPNLEPA